MKILGISGSLRRGSFNTALLRAASGLSPAGVTLAAYTLHGIPLYDADLESSEGVPAPVALLKAALANADALLLVTPEYNNGVPGVFKNAIDWMSRPPDGLDLFRGKPVALLGASTGGFGTTLAQSHWLPVLRALGTDPWFGERLLVSRATGVFDDDGTLTDEKVRGQLTDFLDGFRAFVEG